MTLNYSTPVVNPRLGSSFAIFASAYTCLVLMLVILEQLGLSALTIDQLIVIAPAFFYVAIGFMTRTVNIDDFFVAGQRVPPFYNALALCGMVFGGSILLGSIGSLFFAGIDAIAIPLGCFAGLILTGVLFVPHLRKAGRQYVARVLASEIWTQRRAAFRIPAHDRAGRDRPDRRNRAGRKDRSAIFCPCLRRSEFRLRHRPFSRCSFARALFLTVALGGMRSATWTQGAQFIVLLGILAPLITVSVMRTNLPLPQLTYGSQLEELKSLEAAKGLVTISQPQPLSVSLPKPGAGVRHAPLGARIQRVQRPSTFVLLGLLPGGGSGGKSCIPAKAQHDAHNIVEQEILRSGSASFAGFAVLTIPAYAFFTKAMAIEALVGVPVPNLPAWSRILQQLGLVSLPGNQFDPMSAARGVTFQRDSLALILPVAGSLPRVFFGLAAASALAAISACAAGHLVAIANTVSDDLYHGVLNKGASPGRRLLIARLSMVLLGFAGFPGDAKPSRSIPLGG